MVAILFGAPFSVHALAGQFPSDRVPECTSETSQPLKLPSDLRYVASVVQNEPAGGFGAGKGPATNRGWVYVSGSECIAHFKDHAGKELTESTKDLAGLKRSCSLENAFRRMTMLVKRANTMHTGWKAPVLTQSSQERLEVVLHEWVLAEIPVCSSLFRKNEFCSMECVVEMKYGSHEDFCRRFASKERCSACCAGTEK